MAGDSVCIICGPTAAGKSELAMRLAGARATTVIAADSRQVYRGFDVGTAKPTREEQAAVPHRGVDLADPNDRFSAAGWAARAGAWIAEACANGRTPLVVCGTGLYVRALVAPFAATPAVDPARLAALRGVLASLDAPSLRRWCAELDPQRAALGPAQHRRAIETALLTGQRISALHALAAAARPLRARYLLLDPGPVLASRIAARVDAMLAAGWLDEVRALARIVPLDAPAWQATGYRELRDVVSGARSLSSAREAIIIHTRQYAKRQRTWFRHQLPEEDVTHVGGFDDGAEAIIQSWWAA